MTQKLVLTLMVGCGGLIAPSAYAQESPAPVADSAASDESADSSRSPPPDPAPAPPAKSNRLTYSLGLRAAVGDLQNPQGNVSVRPVAGLRWGRWRLGIGDGTEWLRFSAARRESSLSFSGIETPRLNVSFSLRAQDVKTGGDWMPYDGHDLTIKGRASLGVNLTTRSALGIDIGQDLLNRGTGTTLGIGLSRTLIASDKDRLSIGGSVKWANREHWRNIYQNNPKVDTLHSGWGAMGANLSYRRRLTEHWAMFSSLGPSRPLGQMRQIENDRWVWSGEVGIIRFWQ